MGTSSTSASPALQDPTVTSLFLEQEHTATYLIICFQESPMTSRFGLSILMEQDPFQKLDLLEPMVRGRQNLPKMHRSWKTKCLWEGKSPEASKAVAVAVVVQCRILGPIYTSSLACPLAVCACSSSPAAWSSPSGGDTEWPPSSAPPTPASTTSTRTPPSSSRSTTPSTIPT